MTQAAAGTAVLLALAVALALAQAAPPAHAQPGTASGGATSAAPGPSASPSPASEDPVDEEGRGGPQVTVLLHHPDDGVDPFGFPYAGGEDYFTARYAPLVADKQRFDFPFFVADGVLPLETLPDPGRPFESAREAYSAAAAQRLLEQPPVTLRLASTAAGGSVALTVAVEPTAPLAGEDLHLLVALAEDPVRYLGPPSLANGIEDHRFTVRAVHDLGAVDATTGSLHAHSFRLGEGWAEDRLLAAAWLQQGAPSSRFDAREVVQATSAPVGQAVVQSAKGVLLEMLSATWCDPCLYGDLAIEAVAIAHGAARPLQAGDAARYFEPPSSPWLAGGAALAAGLAAAAWRGGRRA